MHYTETMLSILDGIQLPDVFIRNISHSFQQKGIAWLEQLPHLVDTLVERWQLSRLQLSPELSLNLILFADHPEHGEVVLKIGVPHPELLAQIHSTRLFQGHGLCQCFAWDESLGAMLLERILPGENLWTVQNPVERCQIVAGIQRNMVIHPPKNHDLPLFRDRIHYACQRCDRVLDVPSFLVDGLHQAAVDYDELETKFGDPVVLHGDLNHSNILYHERVSDTNHGRTILPGWRAIDPNGFVGARPMESARFIENEIRLTAASERMQALERMTTFFADVLGCSRYNIAQAIKIDNLLNTFLCIEFRAPQEWIMSGIAGCAVFDQYMEQIFWVKPLPKPISG